MPVMKILDLTLPSPQQNLACDEALIDFCEEGFDHEILRFWEPTEHFVVLGYSNKISQEVNHLSCRESGVPVLRRPSGGGTVLQGPGCVNFSLVLKMETRPGLKSIRETNEFVLARHKKALESALKREIHIQGTSDLALGTLKFSGNAQRRKRRFVLFHGTFLLNFDIAQIERFLPMPTQQPTYRQNRTHREFLTNLSAPKGLIQETIQEVWEAKDAFGDIPLEKIKKLEQEKYSRDEWNFKF